MIPLKTHIIILTIIINNYFKFFRLAQTCKLFNGSIWALIATIEDSSNSLLETTKLDKFNNLESLSFRFDATVVPQDLSKLTTLQTLQINIVNSLDIRVLTALKNLQELVVLYHDDGSTERLDDLLTEHTQLTKMAILADHIHKLGT